MTKRIICKYVEPDGSSPVSEFVGRLDWKLQKKIFSQLRLLENPDFTLQPPHIKTFRQNRHKGFYELRTRIRQAVRIIFIVDEDGGIILLHGFIKKMTVRQNRLWKRRVQDGFVSPPGLVQRKFYNGGCL